MVKTGLNFLVLGCCFLVLSACLRTAPVDSSANVNEVSPTDKYGVCVVEIDEVTANPKNKLFKSQNKNLKCTKSSKCYHLVVQGTCDYVNTPYVRIKAMERNVENFSDEPEKNGSYRYFTDVLCVGSTYKTDLWLQLKGTDNFEVKNLHYANKNEFKKDYENYEFRITDTYLPKFDAETSEVTGFYDKSSGYQNKLGLCQRKYPLLYNKHQPEN